MVVCKFFRQGNCRYGQNCRFEHVYAPWTSYHAPTQTAQVGCTDEQLMNQVQTDIQTALKGGQWILSGYTPFKEKPSVPGMTQLSPEEARLFIYEAKANNTLNEAIEYMNNICKESRLKYEWLLQPSPTLVKSLRSLFKGETPPSPFTNNTSLDTTNKTASSIFRSAVQNTNTSVFNQTGNSVFNQNQNGFANQNSDAKSVFARANQSVFGPSQQTHNAFADNNMNTNDVGAQSIFKQANQQVFVNQNNAEANSFFKQANQSVFESQMQNNLFTNGTRSVDTSDPFGQNKSAFPSTNDTFQSSIPKNVFNIANNDNVPDQNGNDIYSQMEALPHDILKVFESEDFELGYIPEVPPPKALCF